MVDTFWAAIAALVPSVGVGVLFWFAMRKILRADRDERLAIARMEQEISSGREHSPARSTDSASGRAQTRE